MPTSKVHQGEEDSLSPLPASGKFDVGLSLEFSHHPNSSYSNLVLLANDYLTKQNPESQQLSSTLDESCDSSESSIERDITPPRSKAKFDTESACKICRLEPATVSHFTTPICTGCRAFFRRSVSQQKTYRCLNSKLCGKHNLIPNRRVCKFCRFQRCIDAGMLNAKEQLYNQKLDNPKVSSSETSKSPLTVSLLSPPSTSAFSASGDSILDHFIHFRRKITYDRLQTYYCKKADEDTFVDCNHTVELGLRETNLIAEILSRSSVFEGISENDQRILYGDYSVVWTCQETALSTIRNGGHLVKKMYHADGTSLRLTEDFALKHWNPLFATIKDRRPVIIEMVMRFLLNLAMYTTLEISKFMVNASMNEEELAAFTALLFLRPEILSAVSAESRAILSQRRHQLLRNLSNYLISTGQKVDERMSKIILLISEIQTAIRMVKHAINIIRVTTSEETILPKSYIQLFEEGARDISSLLDTTLPVNFKQSV